MNVMDELARTRKEAVMVLVHIRFTDGPRVKGR
jgi:hypothetical protein